MRIGAAQAKKNTCFLITKHPSTHRTEHMWELFSYVQKMNIKIHHEWKTLSKHASQKATKMATSYFVDDWLLFTGNMEDQLKW